MFIFINNKLELKEISNNDKRVIEAKVNIYKNIDIIKLILNNKDISQSHLENFFEFSRNLNLCGLSSFNGTRIYFRSDQTHRTIEHEFSHNISRYFDLKMIQEKYLHRRIHN